MKPKFNRFWSAALLFSIVLLSACEDGEPGPGFTEATRYGNIVIDLSGQRPDGVDFTKSINFKFAPVGANDLDDASSISFDGDEFRVFELQRFYGMVDDVYQENYVEIDLFDNISEQPSRGVFYFMLATIIESSDNKFFVINFNEYTEFISEDSFTRFSYDENSGKLSFVLEFEVPASSNSTGFDLTVKATANVTVLEQINGGIIEGV